MMRPKNTRRPNRGRDGGGGERRKEKGDQLNLGRRRDSSQLAYAYGGPEAYQSRRTWSSRLMLPRYIRNSPAGGSQGPQRTLPPQLRWGCPSARSWMRTRILPILASRSTSRWNWWYRAILGLHWRKRGKILQDRLSRGECGSSVREFPGPSWEGPGRPLQTSCGGTTTEARRSSAGRLRQRWGSASCCTTPTDA